jgi:glycosyltransferase involved in cell wall biosynthesis
MSPLAVVSDLHAGVGLCFNGVAEPFRRSLQFVRLPMDDADLKRILARSDAVILVRYLLEDEARRIAGWCRRMAIPIYYFIDDNFMVIGEEGWEPWRAFTRDRVAEALTGFAAVLCTSSPLAEYYRALPLDVPVEEIRPVFDAATFARRRRVADRATHTLRVGFIGGPHRGRNLNEQVIPALATVARDVPLEFFTRALPGTADAGGMPFTITAIPHAPFDEFLARWNEIGLDVLVHARADTRNTDYKTDSVLLSALYLGAVPIVAGEPAFGDAGEAEGVLTTEGDAASWARALRRVLPLDVRRELLSRLEVFCRSHFAPAVNERTLQRILASATPTDLATREWRLRQADT